MDGLKPKFVNFCNILTFKKATWAKGIGKEGTIAEEKGEPVPSGFNLAKKVVFHNVKKALGLEEARDLVFGAAPLNPDIREYFMSLNMSLKNGYGMSESSGP